MPNERYDTKGHRVGGRASADKGKFPRRIETGLCPGFEEALNSVADELARFAETVRAMAGPERLVGSEGVAEQAQRIERIARDALTRFGPDPEHIDGAPTRRRRQPMPERVRWEGDAYRRIRRKRIGQAIGRNLPMPVCRFLNWAAQRWAPGLWQDAVKEADEAKAQAEYHDHLARKHADPYDGRDDAQG